MLKGARFRRVVLLVLDGVGVGEMADAKLVRPLDVGANTALSVYSHAGDVFGNLSDLGLGFLSGYDDVSCGWTLKCDLKHFGADSFFGHQEIMGTDPVKPEFAPFCEFLGVVCEVLDLAGVSYELLDGVLVVERCFTVADNIETDPGQAYNVTADLNVLGFDRVCEIARLIRDVVKVPRLIVFGSRDTSLERILASIERKDCDYVGVNAPKSGVYTVTYECVHLGYGVDETKQASYKLVEAGVDVTLIGKTADVIRADGAKYLPCVDTDLVMDTLISELELGYDGLLFVNVQETDLAGHLEDVEKFASKLKIVDRKLSQVFELLGEDDLLVVMADHGDDPCIGHAQHTREQVPVMLYNSRLIPYVGGTRLTMADVGHTVYDLLTGDSLEFGSSFSDLIVLK